MLPKLELHWKQLALFLIIGGLVWVIAFFVNALEPHSDFVVLSIQTVAFVFLTVVLVEFIWYLTGGEPVRRSLRELQTFNKLLNDSHLAGLTGVSPISGDFGGHGDWMQRLKRAHARVDMMGYTLHVWTQADRFQEEVVSLVRRGVRIRFLIMGNNNPKIDSIVNRRIPSINLQLTTTEIDRMLNVLHEIDVEVNKAALVRGSFEYRTVDSDLILCQICKVDNELAVTGYLYSVQTSQSPLLFIQGADSKLFHIYDKEFDDLWTNATKANAPKP